MEKYRMIAPCHFGLEKVLNDELKKLGADNIAVTNGRVAFDGSINLMIRANINCRIAERIGICLGEFPVNTFEDVFQGVKAIEIERFVGRNDKFPVVKGHSLNSKLTSIPALQRTIKKAFADRLTAHYGTSLPETGNLYPIRFFLHKDIMTVTLDSSGEGLSKRGYFGGETISPIRETLAAGIVSFANLNEHSIIADPFCVGGTLLIEAALKVSNTPPGYNRDFVAMDWDICPEAMWLEEKENAKSKIKQCSDFVAYAFSSNSQNTENIKNNAWNAGVARYIRPKGTFEKLPRIVKYITDLPSSFHTLQRNAKETTDRDIAEKERIEQLYKDFGTEMLPLLSSSLLALTPHMNFEKLFGLQATKKRKLYKDMICCNLYEYRD